MAKIAAATLFAVAEAGTLAVTWSDCGDASTHAKVDDLQPSSIETGSTTTLKGSGNVDEDVPSATFSADVSAAGVKLVSCSGDASSDVECKLPLGAGTITLKALTFPISAGEVTIPVDVKVSSIIPPSLAKTSTHVTSSTASGDKLFCLDVNTEKQEELKAEAGTLAVTWSDCGAQHAKVNSLSPSSIALGETTTLTGEGIVDEDVTSANFQASVSAAGVKLVSCSGDGTQDIDCKLPLGAGTITVKAVQFPLKKGDVKIPVDVKVSSVIPPSLATTDTHISATEQNGETAICLDVHTAKQSLSTADRPDCSAAACQANCECSYVKCSDEVDACLAAPNCASSQDCAFACACGDGSCLLKCAASSPSIKALPLAKCITSNCDNSVQV